MDDSAEYRHVKRRRYITVALSVALTTVLCVGYVVADIFDKLPGVLTLQEVEHITAKTPGNAVPAATVVGGLDASKTVDAAAAKALIRLSTIAVVPGTFRVDPGSNCALG